MLYTFTRIKKSNKLPNLRTRYDARQLIMRRNHTHMDNTDLDCDSIYTYNDVNIKPGQLKYRGVKIQIFSLVGSVYSKLSIFKPLPQITFVVWKSGLL